MKLASLSIAIIVVLPACGSESATDGERLYSQPLVDGNTFACSTCHALDEPAADGITRPGHPIGDATRRPSFKNGALTDILDAVNTCRRDWMGAPAWTDGDPEWLALFEFLDLQATVELAPALSFTVRTPPANLAGGDAMRGQDTFNSRCVVCHGVDAVGTERAPPLVGELLEVDYIATRVRTSGNAQSAVYPGLTGGVMPFWSEDRLSDGQLIDLVAFIETNDPRGGNTGGQGGDLRECDATHAKVGQAAQLSTFAHGVSGTATIIDDCTIEVTSFNFDGNGIDVRFYGGVGGNYRAGFSMSEEDLRRDAGYSNETVYAQLPVDRTLDDLDGISVWCVPAGANFGDGQFGAQ